MNGSSHLRGARQHSRTGEISIKDRKPDGAVGIQLVVVIGENQGRFGLQRLCHAGIDPGQSFRKVFEAAQLGDVAGQFIRGPCGSLVKSLCGRWGQPPEPDIAEIHEFPVLNVAEVGRVREHGIQCSSRQCNLGRVCTADGDAPMGAVPAIPYPLAVNRDAHLVLPLGAHFKGSFAIALRLDVFLDNVRPASRSHVGAGGVDNAQQVRFTLHETHRKAVNGKHVERLQSHGVVTTQHVLVSQEIRQVGGQCGTDPLVRSIRNQPATEFQPQQLARIEQLPIPVVAPTVQPSGFVTRRNGFFRHEAFVHAPPVFTGGLDPGEVVGIGFLEEAALVY